MAASTTAPTPSPRASASVGRNMSMNVSTEFVWFSPTGSWPTPAVMRPGASCAMRKINATPMQPPNVCARWTPRSSRTAIWSATITS